MAIQVKICLAISHTSAAFTFRKGGFSVYGGANIVWFPLNIWPSSEYLASMYPEKQKAQIVENLIIVFFKSTPRHK